MLLHTILKKLKITTEGVTVTPENIIKNFFYYTKKIKLYVFSIFLQLKILKKLLRLFYCKIFRKK